MHFPIAISTVFLIYCPALLVLPVQIPESRRILTLWRPDEADGQEVLQVVEQGVFDPEVLLRPDSAGTGSCHHQPGTVQADAG